MAHASPPPPRCNRSSTNNCRRRCALKVHPTLAYGGRLQARQRGGAGAQEPSTCKRKMHNIW
eukprot:12906962-Alexandrium_andersonii.AAC.1